jgi:hypothetical protein
MSVVRWKFTDLATSDTVLLPLNPNQMSTPTTPRDMSWGWGAKVGLQRMRGMEQTVDQAPQWTFGGVILSKDHYDLLLAWSGRLSVLRVDDHLGRAFKVMITSYAPIERLPTATKPWRADYTMTCFFLGEI